MKINLLSALLSIFKNVKILTLCSKIIDDETATPKIHLPFIHSLQVTDSRELRLFTSLKSLKQIKISLID
jgi:hypothetical protein